ncbi:hypothetical protein RQN30_10110 [Arcanobacterium hippocoleae]
MQKDFQVEAEAPAAVGGYLQTQSVERENKEISNGPLGRPVRLGAWMIGNGADFAVRAGNAQLVEVCLFERESDTGKLIEQRYPLARGFQGIWAGHVAGVTPGQLYGYRVHGKWDPRIAMLHNPAKVLLDPYARGIGQVPTLDNSLYGYQNYDQLTAAENQKAARTAADFGAERAEEHPKPHPPIRKSDFSVQDSRDSAPFAALGAVVIDEPAKIPIRGIRGGKR